MRTIVALLLAVLVCVSFLAFLTVSKVRSTVLEPTFYTSVLEANDSYNAIHAGLLEELRTLGRGPAASGGPRHGL